MKGHTASIPAPPSQRVVQRRTATTAFSALATLVLLLSLGTGAHAQVAPLYWEVVNRQTGECLTVHNASLAHAADVRVAPCVGGVHQGWMRLDFGNGFNSFFVKHTDMALDVAHRGTTNGTDVVQGAWNPYPWRSDSFNQQWRLIVVDGHYQLAARHADGMCLDRDGWGDVIINTCELGKWSQQWSFR